MELSYKRFRLTLPSYSNKGNCNNCLIYIEFPYGTANGYSKWFVFTLIDLNGFCWPYVDKYNGHSRFYFGCGLFTISFDWLDKKSIINYDQRN